jgi:hypothetical protein
MIDKSLSRGLAERVLDEMSVLGRTYTRRVAQVFRMVPAKRHAVQHMARAVAAAGEACCLTQVIGNHPKWRWASSCAFIPHVQERNAAAERTMYFVPLRAYFHVDRPSLLDPEAPAVLAVNEHALERLFQRLNVQDPAAVKEELHDAICMALYLLNAARRARLRQVVLPTRSGAFLCSVEPAGLVAKTWIAESAGPCRHGEPMRLARDYFADVGGEEGLGAEIGALPIHAPLSIIEAPAGLVRALAGIAWLREAYVRRPDPVGEGWRRARGQQELEPRAA